MEAAVILKMVEDEFCYRCFIFDVVLSYYGSTVRALLDNPSMGAWGQALNSSKGKLDDNIPVPYFLEILYVFAMAVLYNTLLELFMKCNLLSYLYYLLWSLTYIVGGGGQYYAVFLERSFTAWRYCIIGAVRSLLKSLTYTLGGISGYHWSTRLLKVPGFSWYCPHLWGKNLVALCMLIIVRHLDMI